MLCLLFSIACYLCGMASIAAAFWFMQFYLDRPTAEPFSLHSVSWNLGTFLIFPLQHSLLARTSWKAWISQRIHPLMERPLYVGTSGLALGLVMWLWKPFGPVLFFTPYRLPFDLVFFVSVAMIVWTSKEIGHSELFGLKHGMAASRGVSLEQPELNKKGIFGVIRHPLTTLLIIAVWSHHALTASRLEWNILLTAYSLLGVLFEERDLIRKYGSEYLEYRKKVPAFLPSFALKSKSR